MRNELNVFHYDIESWKYPRNWFCNIKQFFRDCKYAVQRAKYGFCDRDIWSLDSYLSELLYSSLNQLADTTMGYPGVRDFSDEKAKEDGYVDGYDRWQKYLRETAEHFLNTQEWNEEIPINQEIQKLWEEADKYILERNFVDCNDGSGCSKLEYKYSDKEAYNKARDKWLAKESEGRLFREIEKDIAFNMLSDYYFHLWD